MKVGVKEHFEIVNRKAYVRESMPLSRIHIKHISYRPRHITEYVLKSLTRRRCTPDDLVILPLSSSERPRKLEDG